MFEEIKNCEAFVVQSCENLMDVDVTIIVSGKYEKATLVLHEICRSAVRRALHPMPDASYVAHGNAHASEARLIGAHASGSAPQAGKALRRNEPVGRHSPAGRR